MERLEFKLADVTHAGYADLAAALTGVSGVAAVDYDVESASVRVEYDSAFVGEAMLRSSMKGAGYPTEGDAVDQTQEAS